MKIWISSIIFLAAIAFAQDVATIDNGFKGKGAPKHISISVIERDKADALFKQFYQNQEIPFKFPIDGCYARAHEMALIAEQKQVNMGKVYAEGFLQVKTNYPKYPIVRWGWHVAPIAFVKQASGETLLMVFDPSLFNKPVTVEEWKQKMLDTSNGAKPYVSSIYYGTKYQYIKNVEPYKNNS